MRSRAGHVAVGAVLGAVLALVGVVLAPDGATVASGPAAFTTTTATAVGPLWHDPHETVIGPAVVVPVSLLADDGEAVLTYRVESITPAVEGIVFEDESGPPIGLEAFVLEVGDREVEGQATRLGSTEVRFDVGADFDVADVTGVRVERYWMRVPHTSDFDLPALRGATFDVDDLISVTVEAVVEQATGTLVNLDTTRRSNEFISSRNPVVWVTGRGVGWESGFRQSGAGIGGTTGIQLTYDGVLPDPMPLTVSASQWIPVDRAISLDIDGMSR